MSATKIRFSHARSHIFIFHDFSSDEMTNNCQCYLYFHLRCEMIHLNCYLSELENEMLNDEHSSNVSHHSAKKNTKEKDCSAEQEVENEMLNDEHVSHHSANKNTKEKDCSAEQEVENEPKLQNCYYCGKQYKKNRTSFNRHT